MTFKTEPIRLLRIKLNSLWKKIPKFPEFNLPIFEHRLDGAAIIALNRTNRICIMEFEKIFCLMFRFVNLFLYTVVIYIYM